MPKPENTELATQETATVPLETPETAVHELLLTFCRHTPVGVEFIGTPPFEEWERIFHFRQDQSDVSNWNLGDTVNFGQRTYGEKFSQIIPEDRLKKRTLMAVAIVCDKIPAAERIPGLNFSHHKATAYLPAKVRKELLELAVEQKWTVRELEEAVSSRTASKPSKSKVIHVDTAKWQIIDVESTKTNLSGGNAESGLTKSGASPEKPQAGEQVVNAPTPPAQNPLPKPPTQEESSKNGLEGNPTADALDTKAEQQTDNSASAVIPTQGGSAAKDANLAKVSPEEYAADCLDEFKLAFEKLDIVHMKPLAKKTWLKRMRPLAEWINALMEGSK